MTEPSFTTTHPDDTLLDPEVAVATMREVFTQQQAEVEPLRITPDGSAYEPSPVWLAPLLGVGDDPSAPADVRVAIRMALEYIDVQRRKQMAIAALHRRWVEGGANDDACQTCGDTWPCETVTILQGRPLGRRRSQEGR